MELKEGLLFADRYKLIRQLGRGGFAEVWLAEDDLTNVQVAVKIYAPGTGLDDNGIRIFKDEFAMVFDMNHTNLLRPTHFDCCDRMPYLIMPLIKNGSAFKYIVENQNIPEEEAWKMLHDVAAGLAYLHEKTPPLIHQDIKPDNIMIGDEGQYLITDFGISARVRSTIRGARAQEQSGGTLAYMGPERFSTNPRPIMASDIWSLGAMMYELMTGLPPFGNHGGMLQKNGADIPIIEGEYSQELMDIVTMCLAKETWDRPSASKIEEMTYNHMHGITTPVQTPVQTPTPEPEPEPEPVAPAMPKEETKVQDTAQPQAPIRPPLIPPTQEGKTEGIPTIKKSKPIQKGSNKNVIIGAIVGAVVLIGILVAVFSGGGEEEQPVVVEVTPRVNYDSIAQVKIQEALLIKEGADTIIKNHPDEYTDASIYNNVEDIYMKALVKLDEALADQDSLDAGVISSAQQQQTAIKAALLGIYKNLDSGAEYVQEFRTRADAIKPLISDLLNNQDNKTDEDNDEEDD